MLQPQGIPVPHAHVSPLPGRCEEAPRRLSEDLGEDTLSTLDGASGFFGIQAVHLVAGLREQRGGPPASQTLMTVAVKEKLLGTLMDEPAVVRMRREWPLAVPVGNHAEGETTSEKGCEVLDDRPSLTSVGRSGVVDTDKEAPHDWPAYVLAFSVMMRVPRTPPYRRSRAENA